MTHLPQQTQSFPRIETDLSGPRHAEYFQATFCKIQKYSFKEQTSKYPKSCRFPPTPSQGQIFNLLDVQSHV